MRLITGLFAMLTLGATAPCLGQDARSEAANAAECALPDGWSEVAAQEPLYVVFGEMHGTREGPEFFGTLACALASRGERVLLAVEHHAIHNAALQTAWNMPAGQFEHSLVKTGWAGRLDGVASEAMYAMLVRAHTLKERGLQIAVAAFNGNKDADQGRRFAHLPGQGPHEAAQAENIADAARLADYDRVLVLVGNAHARKDTIERGGFVYEPMARHLGSTAKTVTLNMRYGTGTAWNCVLKPGAKLEPGRPIPPDAIDCGNHPLRGSGDFDRPPFIALGAIQDGPSIGEFDGFFWVGAITGAPPQLAAP